MTGSPFRPAWLHCYTLSPSICSQIFPSQILPEWPAGFHRHKGDLAVVSQETSDSAWIARHLETFVEVAGQIGIPPDVVRNLAGPDFARIAFQVEHVFDQPPGIGAGEPM